MHWTYEDLMGAPEDLVDDLVEKWRAESLAKQIRSRSGK